MNSSYIINQIVETTGLEEILNTIQEIKSIMFTNEVQFMKLLTSKFPEVKENTCSWFDILIASFTLQNNIIFNQPYDYLNPLMQNFQCDHDISIFFQINSILYEDPLLQFHPSLNSTFFYEYFETSHETIKNCLMNKYLMKELGFFFEIENDLSLEDIFKFSIFPNSEAEIFKNIDGNSLNISNASLREIFSARTNVSSLNITKKLSSIITKVKYYYDIDGFCGAFAIKDYFRLLRMPNLELSLNISKNTIYKNKMLTKSYFGYTKSGCVKLRNLQHFCLGSIVQYGVIMKLWVIFPFENNLTISEKVFEFVKILKKYKNKNVTKASEHSREIIEGLKIIQKDEGNPNENYKISGNISCFHLEKIICMFFKVRNVSDIEKKEGFFFLETYGSKNKFFGENISEILLTYRSIINFKLEDNFIVDFCINIAQKKSYKTERHLLISPVRENYQDFFSTKFLNLFACKYILNINSNLLVSGKQIEALFRKNNSMETYKVFKNLKHMVTGIKKINHYQSIGSYLIDRKYREDFTKRISLGFLKEALLNVDITSNRKVFNNIKNRLLNSESLIHPYRFEISIDCCGSALIETLKSDLISKLYVNLVDQKIFLKSFKESLKKIEAELFFKKFSLRIFEYTSLLENFFIEFYIKGSNNPKYLDKNFLHLFREDRTNHELYIINQNKIDQIKRICSNLGCNTIRIEYIMKIINSDFLISNEDINMILKLLKFLKQDNLEQINVVFNEYRSNIIDFYGLNRKSIEENDKVYINSKISIKKTMNALVFLDNYIKNESTNEGFIFRKMIHLIKEYFSIPYSTIFARLIEKMIEEDFFYGFIYLKKKKNDEAVLFCLNDLSDINDLEKCKEIILNWIKKNLKTKNNKKSFSLSFKKNAAGAFLTYNSIDESNSHKISRNFKRPIEDIRYGLFGILKTTELRDMFFPLKVSEQKKIEATELFIIAREFIDIQPSTFSILNKYIEHFNTPVRISSEIFHAFELYNCILSKKKYIEFSEISIKVGLNNFCSNNFIYSSKEEMTLCPCKNESSEKIPFFNDLQDQVNHINNIVVLNTENYISGIAQPNNDTTTIEISKRNFYGFEMYSEHETNNQIDIDDIRELFIQENNLNIVDNNIFSIGNDSIQTDNIINLNANINRINNESFIENPQEFKSNDNSQFFQTNDYETNELDYDYDIFENNNFNNEHLYDTRNDGENENKINVNEMNNEPGLNNGHPIEHTELQDMYRVDTNATVNNEDPLKMYLDVPNQVSSTNDLNLNIIEDNGEEKMDVRISNKESSCNDFNYDINVEKVEKRSNLGETLQETRSNDLNFDIQEEKGNQNCKASNQEKRSNDLNFDIQEEKGDRNFRVVNQEASSNNVNVLINAKSEKKQDIDKLLQQAKGNDLNYNLNEEKGDEKPNMGLHNKTIRTEDVIFVNRIVDEKKDIKILYQDTGSNNLNFDLQEEIGNRNFRVLNQDTGSNDLNFDIHETGNQNSRVVNQNTGSNDLNFDIHETGNQNSRVVNQNTGSKNLNFDIHETGNQNSRVVNQDTGSNDLNFDIQEEKRNQNFKVPNQETKSNVLDFYINAKREEKQDIDKLLQETNSKDSCYNMNEEKGDIKLIMGKPNKETRSNVNIFVNQDVDEIKDIEVFNQKTGIDDLKFDMHEEKGNLDFEIENKETRSNDFNNDFKEEKLKTGDFIGKNSRNSLNSDINLKNGILMFEAPNVETISNVFDSNENKIKGETKQNLGDSKSIDLHINEEKKDERHNLEVLKLQNRSNDIYFYNNEKKIEEKQKLDIANQEVSSNNLNFHINEEKREDREYLVKPSNHDERLYVEYNNSHIEEISGKLDLEVSLQNTSSNDMKFNIYRVKREEEQNLEVIYIEARSDDQNIGNIRQNERNISVDNEKNISNMMNIEENEILQQNNIYMDNNLFNITSDNVNSLVENQINKNIDFLNRNSMSNILYNMPKRHENKTQTNFEVKNFEKESNDCENLKNGESNQSQQNSYLSEGKLTKEEFFDLKKTKNIETNINLLLQNGLNTNHIKEILQIQSDSILNQKATKNKNINDNICIENDITMGKTVDDNGKIEFEEVKLDKEKELLDDKKNYKKIVGDNSYEGKENENVEAKKAYLNIDVNNNSELEKTKINIELKEKLQHVVNNMHDISESKDNNGKRKIIIDDSYFINLEEQNKKKQSTNDESYDLINKKRYKLHENKNYLHDFLKMGCSNPTKSFFNESILSKETVNSFSSQNKHISKIPEISNSNVKNHDNADRESQLTTTKKNIKYLEDAENFQISEKRNNFLCNSNDKSGNINENPVEDYFDESEEYKTNDNQIKKFIKDTLNHKEIDDMEEMDLQEKLNKNILLNESDILKDKETRDPQKKIIKNKQLNHDVKKMQEADESIIRKIIFKNKDEKKDVNILDDNKNSREIIMNASEIRKNVSQLCPKSNNEINTRNMLENTKSKHLNPNVTNSMENKNFNTDQNFLNDKNSIFKNFDTDHNFLNDKNSIFKNFDTDQNFLNDENSNIKKIELSKMTIKEAVENEIKNYISRISKSSFVNTIVRNASEKIGKQIENTLNENLLEQLKIYNFSDILLCTKCQKTIRNDEKDKKYCMYCGSSLEKFHFE